MHYDATGQLRQLQLIDDPARVDRYRTWRDAALAAAFPAGDYDQEYAQAHAAS